jgi:hypothetical protein
MICLHIRPECWTSQGCLSCNLWKSVYCDWTAINATHNCMPVSESILAVTASWSMSVCGFCLCGVRGWKFYVWWFLWMKELLNLLQRCWIGRWEPIPWPGRSCDFTLLDNIFWDNFTEHIYIPPLGILPVSSLMSNCIGFCFKWTVYIGENLNLYLTLLTWITTHQQFTSTHCHLNTPNESTHWNCTCFETYSLLGLYAA